MDTGSDIALYGHELKLQRLRAKEARRRRSAVVAAGGAASGTKASATKAAGTKVSGQATDEILVRLLSLAHAGLLHPHMSLGLAHRHPRHLPEGDDMHAAALREERQMSQVDGAAAAGGGSAAAAVAAGDPDIAGMIRQQMDSLARGPTPLPPAPAVLPRAPVVPLPLQQLPRASAARAQAPASAAAGDTPAAAPPSLWGMITAPLRSLFNDAAVHKVEVPS